MDIKEYTDLLHRVRSSLPDEIFEKSRFQLPKIDSFIEGNRTIITNWRDITKQIRRDEHVAKLLAKDLATSYSLDKTGRLAFSGKFGNSSLNKMLSDYVKAFVICNECSKPDTKLVRESRRLVVVCEACGSRHSAKR